LTCRAEIPYKYTQNVFSITEYPKAFMKFGLSRFLKLPVPFIYTTVSATARGSWCLSNFKEIKVSLDRVAIVEATDLERIIAEDKEL
jgi:hypothetical protein